MKVREITDPVRAEQFDGVNVPGLLAHYPYLYEWRLPHFDKHSTTPPDTTIELWFQQVRYDDSHYDDDPCWMPMTTGDWIVYHYHHHIRLVDDANFRRRYTPVPDDTEDDDAESE